MYEIILLFLNTFLDILLIMLWIPIITKDKYNPLRRILLGKHEFSGANIMVKPNGIVEQFLTYSSNDKDDWDGCYYPKLHKMRIHKNVMNKTPEFVCKVISHEFLHYLLHVEYDGITSTQLDNLCEDSKTINNSGIDDW